MILIGELINGTRKAIKEAIAAKDAALIRNLARAQAEAGAAFIDCNPGTVGEQESSDMRWLVENVQAVTDQPVTFDSPNAEALRAGLGAYGGQATPMINSITLEGDRVGRILPLVTEHGTNVIALAMSDRGVPDDVASRVENANQLIGACTEAGVPPERIFLDPVITMVAQDACAAMKVLEAVRTIRAGHPQVHITAGLSNISFGLPHRALLNRAFLAMMTAAGMDSAICDPLDQDLMAMMAAAEALTGRDEFCMGYIGAARAGKLGA